MTGNQTAPKHTAIIKQAVLLARFIALLRLPKRPILSVASCRFAPLTVAGPRRLIRLLF